MDVDTAYEGKNIERGQSYLFFRSLYVAHERAICLNLPIQNFAGEGERSLTYP